MTGACTFGKRLFRCIAGSHTLADRNKARVDGNQPNAMPVDPT